MLSISLTNQRSKNLLSCVQSLISHRQLSHFEYRAKKSSHWILIKHVYTWFNSMQALSYQWLLHYFIVKTLIILFLVSRYFSLLLVLRGLLCFKIFLEVYLETSYPNVSSDNEMNVYYLFIKCLSNDKTRLLDRLVPLFLQLTHL